MYTRSYYTDKESIRVPQNYDGYAIEREEEEKSTEASLPEEKAEEGVSTNGEGIREGIFAFLPRFGVNFFKNGIQDIGSEELLLIAVAIFLLLSKNGDMECAVMLFLLIFIK